MPESKVRKAAADKRRRANPKSTPTTDKAGDKAGASSRSAAARSGDTVSRGTTTTRPRVSRVIEDTRPQRRWLLPATIVLAVLGIAWGVLAIVDDTIVPFQKSLGTTWNLVIGAAAVLLAVVLFLTLRPRSGTPYAPGSRRWVPPTFIAIGLLGVAWLIVYYVAGSSIPFMAALGNWNILIGMAGMAAAFVIATLWK